MQILKFAQWIIRQKQRLEYAKGYFSSLSSFILVSLYLRSYSVPDWLLLPLSVLFVLFLWVCGYLAEKTGVWGYENARSTSELNPHLADIIRKKDGLSLVPSKNLRR